MKDLGYFSGQGKVCLAKINPETGELGEFFTCNAPKFEGHFAGLLEGELMLELEGFGSQILDLYFGGSNFKTNTSEFKDIYPKDFKHTFPNAPATGTKITRKKKQHYYLVFEGFNTANSNNPLRVELQDVKFNGVERFEFIGNDITTFLVTGNFLANSSGEFGTIYNLDDSSEALLNYINNKEKKTPAKRKTTSKKKK